MLLSTVFGLLLPGAVLIVGSSSLVQRSVQVRSVEHVKDLLHHLGESLGGSPLVPSLNHVLADFSLVTDVGMVNLGLEAYDGRLEGEVVENELNGELSAFEWSAVRSSDVNIPQAFGAFDYDELFLL